MTTEGECTEYFCLQAEADGKTLVLATGREEMALKATRVFKKEGKVV